MPRNLAQTRPAKRSQFRQRTKKHRPVKANRQKIDAATLAASIQLQEQQREVIYSIIALIMKVGLLTVGFASLVRLGLASVQRVNGHMEVSSVLAFESAKLEKMQERFDRLFTIGGARRLIDEEDQWIAPNRVRIIWR